MSRTLIIEVNEDASSVVCATLLDGDNNISTIEPDALPSLPHDGRTIVVMDGRSVAVHAVELPVVDDAKARKILPAVLDDKLASNDAPCHMALLGEQNADSPTRVVATVACSVMDTMLGLMQGLNLSPECVVPDFMLLVPADNEPVQLRREETLLVRLPDGSGYGLEEASARLLHSASARALDGEAWLDCLREAVFCRANLLQGAYAPRTSMRVSLLWWRRSALLAGVALLFGAVSVWYEASENFHRADQMYENAEQLFRRALPEETRIVNMEVQLRRAVAARRRQAGGEFFVLSNQVLRAVQAGDQALLETMRYSQENGDLVLDVSFASFAESTEFKRTLEQYGMQVTEGSSRQESGRVVSEIRVRRP